MRLSAGWVVLLLVVAILAGLGAYGYHVASRVLVLRVATGPEGSFGAQFATSLVHLVSLDHPRVKVLVSRKPTSADALKALAAGEADLAVSRADEPGPVGQTIVVLKHDAGLFLVPHNGKADSVAALRGVALGVVGSSPVADAKLLETIGKTYGFPDQPAPTPLAPEDVAAALHVKKVQAIFVVGSAGGQTITRTLAAVRSAGGGQPHVIAVDEAGAIVKRDHLLESVDLPKGVLQGQPPLPDDDGSTIGVSTRLFATSAMPDAIAAEITRMLLADKPRVASLMPASTVIEPPETDKPNASLPVHSGAAAYLSGNQPSVSDQAQNLLYWIGIIGSLFASCAAALAALWARLFPKRPKATLSLLDLWVAAQDAGKGALDDIEARVDALVRDAVRLQANGKGEDINAAFPLLVSQVKRTIDRRRAELGLSPVPLASRAGE